LRRTDFVHGQFGENFTVEGMLEDAVNLGDVFRIGDAVLEVTQPRVPCFKLAVRMGLPQFPKAFLASRRSGFYLRVLAEGTVAAGDEIARIRAAPEQVSVREALDLKFFDKKNRAGLLRILGVKALSNQWREDFEEQLHQWNLVLETNSRV
jgi:MOSC domain-containing protein YiiM